MAVVDDERLAPFQVERFGDFLTLEQGASGRTLEAYQRDVIRLVEYAISKGAARPSDVTSRTLREFVYHLKDVGLSPASIRRSLSAVRTYFRFLLAEGIVVRD